MRNFQSQFFRLKWHQQRGEQLEWEAQARSREKERDQNDDQEKRTKWFEWMKPSNQSNEG